MNYCGTLMTSTEALHEAAEYDLAGRIIGLAMKVHRVLGPGFLESVYGNALALELSSAQIRFEREKPLLVYYEGVLVGKFACDLVVEEKLLVEIKAVSALTPGHEVQTVNYLNAARMDDGLLLNFGPSSLQFKRKYRVYSPRHPK